MTASVVVPLTNVPAPPVQPPASGVLRAPETPLGKARVARGWSQHKVVRALILTADHWGWEIATESSLKVFVSRWENETHRPGATYQVLLCAIFRATPDELGFTRPVPVVSLSQRVTALESLVRDLSEQLGQVAA
ncbi:helix-turn-helix transcriptional regulator [Streptomyces sp. ISL-96]|uniref:helix-turn-helix domain-containing protein n=1 Tax=Streptomyces sp. ISL-96 TaxID=2819191 RepID=UPI001BE6B41E|nr:helix-turn-helix transcriptional regulator [Streptomyces sp. ISL-96]MBT2491051.1 helix-turn-helix transcriptional regulator [Streptomyces sp. ISL-96]